jgi:putative peptide zinc metalloprotease protein
MVVHWSDLTADLADKVLARENLLTILLIFPVLKILHEFGHAYATKLAGEDVHEMGVMLLTMLPAPYVDASSSAMIASKWRRGLVAAAGIIVELAVAAVAMLVWREAQPGLTRSLAYDGLLTASISTLIFNGNPLLRFDAYYVLSDLLEIPNLASRAQRYYLYLLQRYLFGASDAQDPSFAQGERFWFIAYTPLSFAYRMFTLSGIAMFVATRYYAVGVALACWLVVSSVLWPLLKGLKFVLISPNLAGNRARAASVVALGAITVASIVGLVPISNATVARGIVWIPENSRIVAQSSGRLQEFLVDPGANVAIGDPIARLDDPYIAAKHGKAEARLAEIDARLFAAQALNPFDAQVLNRQRDLARQELAEIERQQQNLVVRSPAAGVLIVPHADDMVDGFVKHGQTLGYVMAKRAPVIRASVPEDEIEYFPERTRAVAVRFAESPWTELDSVTINRQVPKSSRRLPSPALATVNGGPFELDPAAKDKNSILDSIFEIDIATSNAFAVERWGQRVWVRFDHGAAPLSERLYRAFRQLFLGRFHV